MKALFVNLLLMTAVTFMPALHVVAQEVNATPVSTQAVNVELISINQADVQQLTALPGIGAKKAQAIVDYREAIGPFTKVEQLKEVKGIGEGIYAKLSDKISL